MAKYEVCIKEVHDVMVVVDTKETGLPRNPTREQLAKAAEQIHLVSSDLEMEYDRTLDPVAWTYRNMKTGDYL